MDLAEPAVIRISNEEPSTMETPAAAPSSPPSTAAAESPALKLTERACQQVKDVMKAQGFEGYYFSVRVTPSGCSGMGYDLNLVKEARPDDLTWEQDGVKIATDPLSTQYLGGTEVDYVSSLQGAGFKFTNPNAKSSCGCGTSFST
jgi:iron-sulfur cluster assembly protein